MLTQTKTTIEKLKKAGLKRNQFRVQVQRNYIGRHPETGKQCFEYGNVDISIRDLSISGLDWAKKIAETRLYVIVLHFERSDNLIIKDTYSKQGIVEIQDHTVYPPTIKKVRVL